MRMGWSQSNQRLRPYDSRNVQEAAQGTEEVNASMENVSRGAQETGSAADSVLTSANELSQQADSLKVEMEKSIVTGQIRKLWLGLKMELVSIYLLCLFF